jgi:hypothetical protein
MQVHAARLTSDIEVDLGWRWRHGPEVVLKVQNAKMQARCLPMHQSTPSKALPAYLCYPLVPLT